MSENQIKLSIFNPADKTVDKTRYYFEYIPYTDKYKIKRNFKYDTDVKKYYSNDVDDVKDYKLVHVDIFGLTDSLDMKYDKDIKRWVTYAGNDKIDNNFIMKTI